MNCVTLFIRIVSAAVNAILWIGSKNLMRACLETTAAWIRQDSLRSQLIWVEQTTVHSDRECEHSDSPCQAYTQMHRKTWLHVCIWDSNANTWNHWTTFFWLLILSICHNLLLIMTNIHSFVQIGIYIHREK